MVSARDATAPNARGRLLIVSNRLPVSIRETNGGFESASSSGGVAVGLHGFYRTFGATWIGWPGLAVESESRRRKLAIALAQLGLLAVICGTDTLGGLSVRGGIRPNFLPWKLIGFAGRNRNPCGGPAAEIAVQRLQGACRWEPHRQARSIGWANLAAPSIVSAE